ncbi:hypothetical protein KFU94_18415 [Chloroflexi bacterium TSY]|nr:hypothetical protein [Chloroflexi bacterium TSY]
MIDFLEQVGVISPNAGLSAHIPYLTLLILGTITIFALLEISSLHQLDKTMETLERIDSRTAELDIDLIAEELRHARYAGINQVPKRFPTEIFCERLTQGTEIRILNIWIPNLNDFIEPLIAAIQNGADVKILLLYPRSPITELRNEALRVGPEPFLEELVQMGIMNNFAALKYIAEKISDDQRNQLQVRAYHSLPSISIYRVDHFYLVGLFFHGSLAIHRPQLEIRDSSSVLGQRMDAEFNTLWSIGRPIHDLRNWRIELDRLTDQF